MGGISELWNDKVKVNTDFTNNFIRHAILRVWNRHKARLSPKIPLLLSPKEGFFRREIIVEQTWLLYVDLLTF